MSDWTSGYVADLDYSHDFFREMTPSLMAFSALSKGQKQRLDQGRLSYCELGCGQGFTSNLLAAANPHIDFHAMDFSPSHIVGAKHLAQDAALDNVFFYERSFADFDQQDGLPDQFDVIALHGVMSWVSKENQSLVIDFIGKRLKPGGLVYVSYNSLAAWASAMPLRRVLLDRADQATGQLEGRVEDALEFANTLEQAGARYFIDNPSASARLGSTKTMSRTYLAHELFNADWTPFHFGDIAGDLGQAKLNFLGSANVLEHLDEISLTPKQIALLAQESDPVRREALRDVLVNEQFRMDLFVKGSLPYQQRGAVAAWFDMPLALMTSYSGGVLKQSWRLGEIPLDHTQYEPILTALGKGPQTVRQLLNDGAFGEMNWGEITRLLSILIGTGSLSPCLPQDDLEARRQRCQAFNQAVCSRAQDSDTLGFLASPVTGGGLALDRFEQLFLLALGEGKESPREWADLAWQILSSQGQRVQLDGRALEHPEENLAVLNARAQAFASRRLPLCEALGISLISTSQDDQAAGHAEGDVTEQMPKPSEPVQLHQESAA